ncbi:hypothetical protein DEDE109153_15825 [Deinococcus deserti]
MPKRKTQRRGAFPDTMNTVIDLTPKRETVLAQKTREVASRRRLQPAHPVATPPASSGHQASFEQTP